ncbi:M1 family metallopeptidase [Paraclostridium bifermentans]|uniref:M1 family metallopeptidase n=1 Tax=Paraclostridium bifermentans TaxID=1490 RepID=UPI00359C3C87
MVVDFRKKTRRNISMLMAGIIFLVGLIYFDKESEKQVFNNINNKVNEYKMDVILDDESKRLMCNQTIDYVNNTKESLDSIYFHIYPNAFSEEENVPFEKSQMKQAYPKGFNEGYIDIKNIIINNSKAEYSIEGEKNDILNIKLNKGLKANENIKIDIKFNVKLPNSEGRFGYGENTINITNWFPIACVYDERGWNTKSYETIGDPFYSDISNFKVTILSPAKYDIATTGKVIETKTDNKKDMNTIEAKNVRDFAFILSDKFHIEKDNINNVEIVTYSLDSKYSKLATDVARDSIKIFSDMFGQYPYENYSVIASDFYIGGMEYPNLSMIDKSLYSNMNKFLLEYVIAHETAHQWWYGVIGNDEVSEPWIDEALTEYSTILYFEKKYGADAASRLMETMDTQTRSYSDKDIFKSTDQYKSSTEYSLNVYTKGAVMFHRIREEVGDKVFFKVLREYYETYKFKNVNGTQFVELWGKNGVDIEKIIGKYK